jgi:hypothetical protein
VALSLAKASSTPWTEALYWSMILLVRLFAWF